MASKASQAAAVAYTAKKYKDALPLLQEVIKEEPENAVAHFQLGNCLRNDKKVADALKMYQEAIRLDICYASAYKNAGIILIDQKRYDDAITMLEQAQISAPDADLSLMLAETYLIKKDAKKALLILGTALDRFAKHEKLRETYIKVAETNNLDPEETSSHYLRFFDAGDLNFRDKLVANESKVIRYMFQQEDTMLRKSDIVASSFQPTTTTTTTATSSEAATSSKASTTTSIIESSQVPSNEAQLLASFDHFTHHSIQSPVHLAVTLAKAKLSRPDSFNLSETEVAGLWLYSLRNTSLDLNRALRSQNSAPVLPFLALVNAAIAKLPKHQQVVACCSSEKGIGSQFTVGVELISNQITHVTRSVDVCLDALNHHHNNTNNDGNNNDNDDNKTIFIIESAAVVDLANYSRYACDEELVLPFGSKFVVLSVRVLDENTRFIHLRHLVEKVENDIKIKYAAALSAYQAKKWKEVAPLLEEIVILDPTHSMACFQLANAYRNLKKYDDAISFYEKAISLQPAFLDAHVNLGLTLVELVKKPDQAIEAYKRAIAVCPGSVTLYQQLILLLKKKDKEGADKFKKEALTVFPNHPDLMKI